MRVVLEDGRVESGPARVCPSQVALADYGVWELVMDCRLLVGGGGCLLLMLLMLLQWVIAHESTVRGPLLTCLHPAPCTMQTNLPRSPSQLSTPPAVNSRTHLTPTHGLLSSPRGHQFESPLDLCYSFRTLLEYSPPHGFMTPPCRHYSPYIYIMQLSCLASSLLNPSLCLQRRLPPGFASWRREVWRWWCCGPQGQTQGAHGLHSIRYGTVRVRIRY